LKFANVIIDLNNLYWRSITNTIKKIIEQEEEDKFYSMIIQDSLERINQLKNVYGNNETNVYILHDNPFSKINERELIDSSYKHARKNKNIPQVFYKSLEKLIEILKSYDNNFYIVSHNKCEADDLVLPIINKVKNSCLLISADLDWARSVSQENRIYWFNYHKVYDVDTFIDDYGFNPSGNGVKIYKAIHGDKSDCIENAVPYLPKIILSHIIENYDSIYDLLANMWKNEEIPKQWKLKIQEAQIQLKINYQLVDFITLDLTFTDIAYKCLLNIEKLRSWFALLDIPFFNFMIDPKRDSHNFLERKRYKRVLTV